MKRFSIACAILGMLTLTAGCYVRYPGGGHPRGNGYYRNGAGSPGHGNHGNGHGHGHGHH